MHSRSRRVGASASYWAGVGAMVGALLFAISGCGGSSGTAGSLGAPTPQATPTIVSCPGAHHPTAVGRWPRPIPADLPKPPSGTRPSVAFRNLSLTVVRFSTALSLREAVLFILQALPAKGFLIGRGDAEPGQADAPFSRSGLFGQIRLNLLDACHTQWLVAIGTPQNAGGSPLLPNPTGSASPVPFGQLTFGG